MDLITWAQGLDLPLKIGLSSIFTLIWLFAIAVLWIPQAQTGKKDLVDRGYLGIAAPKQVAAGDLTFEHFWGTTTSKQRNIIHLAALQIRGKNVSTNEVQLKDAFLISGVTGAKRSMMIDVGPDGWIIPSEANPVPPNAGITLRAEFNPPEGLSAREFMHQWGSIYFVVQCEGSEYRDTFTREEIAAIFAVFAEHPDGPRPTKKQ
jgi:hypothetical protein